MPKRRVARPGRDRKRSADPRHHKPRVDIPSAPHVTRRFRWGALSIIALLAAHVNPNTLNNDLVYDDRVIVVQNERVRDPLDFRDIWLESGWLPDRSGGEYRPLGLWSFARPGRDACAYFRYGVSIVAPETAVSHRLLPDLSPGHVGKRDRTPVSSTRRRNGSDVPSRGRSPAVAPLCEL